VTRFGRDSDLFRGHSRSLPMMSRVLLLIALLPAPVFAGTLLDVNFNALPGKVAPAGWRTFLPDQKADVTVLSKLGEGMLLGRRSPSAGLVALSRDFVVPAKRILIEFDFAFSAGNARSLNVWSHEPVGKDASQFNLCIERGALRQFDGEAYRWEPITERVKPSASPDAPVWHRLRALVDAEHRAIDYWVSEPGSRQLPETPTATMVHYRTGLPIGGIDFVSGRRIGANSWYLIDNLVVRDGTDLPAPHSLPQAPAPYRLWSGGDISDPEKIPFVDGVQHRIIHGATADGYRFLHGAAIIQHRGTLFANWANSLVDENSASETLQGRRSTDGGQTWSELEMIAPGFANQERHSHGVLMSHQGRLWTFCSRFGIGTDGRRFDGLQAEAFVLDESGEAWQSRGIVMTNCWPYDEPVRLADGNHITGGQDRDGYPVVAISRGDDLLHWDSVLIPFPPRLAPSFAETTVIDLGDKVLAVIRGGRNVAWVSMSADGGRTWTLATESNLPMPRAKAYLGRLSTGQFYLISNVRNRDTLAVSVSEPGGTTLKQMWRIRHGRSEAPRFKGHAKGPQWSYPYAHEADGRLYVVYSIGKEDCGLSIIPLSSLQCE
jgi:hypothetical protein